MPFSISALIALYIVCALLNLTYFSHNIPYTESGKRLAGTFLAVLPIANIAVLVAVLFLALKKTQDSVLKD